MVPQYMVCTLILSEHNKGIKKYKLNYSIFPRNVYNYVCRGILRFVPWEERSPIWRNFFNKWI